MKPRYIIGLLLFGAILSMPNEGLSLDNNLAENETISQDIGYDIQKEVFTYELGIMVEHKCFDSVKDFYTYNVGYNYTNELSMVIPSVDFTDLTNRLIILDKPKLPDLIVKSELNIPYLYNNNKEFLAYRRARDGIRK